MVQAPPKPQPKGWHCGNCGMTFAKHVKRCPDCNSVSVLPVWQNNVV